jgi:hypothetical protein
MRNRSRICHFATNTKSIREWTSGLDSANCEDRKNVVVGKFPAHI